jgi:hypothetical protein
MSTTASAAARTRGVSVFSCSRQLLLLLRRIREVQRFLPRRGNDGAEGAKNKPTKTIVFRVVLIATCRLFH